MKPEALLLAVGGIGWLIDGYLLFPTTPKFALFICVPIAITCLYFGRKA